MIVEQASASSGFNELIKDGELFRRVVGNQLDQLLQLQYTKGSYVYF
jgi:hypothetical protein